MASFSAGTTFTDGVANDVTAAKLAALVNAATPTSGLIQDRTAETAIAVNDTLLIGDASDSNNLKRMTVDNFAGTLPTATITSGTITNLASTTGTIATLNSTTGTIATLNSTTGTIATLNSTTGTIATLNSTTGTIATLNSTTPTFLGAITASTNTINVGSGQIFKDASGNFGVGTTSPSSYGKLAVVSSDNTEATVIESLISNNLSAKLKLGFNRVVGDNATAANASLDLGVTSYPQAIHLDSSGQVGIGTTSPNEALHINGSTNLKSAIRLQNQGTNFGFIGTEAARVGSGSSNNLSISSFGTNSIVLSSETTERLRIDSSGDCLVTSNARLGYGAGSGGTVTQVTSKTTGVTLNKPTGQITMHNANLANTATVRFALTNSFISAVDILAVNAASFAGYTTTCENTATGAATIRVTNVSGGGLAEAVILQFVVIKGSAT